MKFLFVILVLSYFVIYNSFARSDLNNEEYARVKIVTTPTTSFTNAERSEAMTGGAGTVDKTGKNSYSHHFTTLNYEDKQNFLIGNGLFRKLWVAAPSSTTASDGLGPLYNARACQSCHIKDGRGHLPNTEKPLSLVIKVGDYKNFDLIPDKTYGKQFQFFGIPGMISEVQGKLKKNNFYENIYKKYANLETVNFEISSLNYGNLKANSSLSLRISPQVYGVGLLESIEQSDILKKQDIFDSNKDGVSGIARMVVSKNGKKELGRFGIRASTPNLLTQSGVAFMHDMGLSNPLGKNPFGDCTQSQEKCFSFISGINHNDKNEISDLVLEKIAFYMASLSPPKRRDVNDKDVLRGKEIFYKSNCTACHTPKYVTSKNAKHDFLRYQLIWPYTDLLLHDMGEKLADKDLNGNFTNKEWKTPPLWGIGLAKEVNPRASFLHDGRADTILEAILWHGGESKKSIKHLISNYGLELDKLVKFVKSL